jgi:hypothetical protein
VANKRYTRRAASRVRGSIESYERQKLGRVRDFTNDSNPSAHRALKPILEQKYRAWDDGRGARANVPTVRRPPLKEETERILQQRIVLLGAKLRR